MDSSQRRPHLRTESLANRPAATASHPIVRVGADRLIAYQLEFDAGDLLALARAATTDARCRGR